MARFIGLEFDFADIIGWISFTGDWCQMATCYLCCESCTCSWSSLSSLNKCSHRPLRCRLSLLTLLCNCCFISPSWDFSLCPDWQAKGAVSYVHTQEGQEGRLLRRESRAGCWGREWALALWLPPCLGRASPHRLHLLHQSAGREGKLASNFDSIMSCFNFLFCVWLQNMLSDLICIVLSWRCLSFII